MVVTRQQRKKLEDKINNFLHKVIHDFTNSSIIPYVGYRVTCCMILQRIFRNNRHVVEDMDSSQFQDEGQYLAACDFLQQIHNISPNMETYLQNASIVELVEATTDVARIEKFMTFHQLE